MASAPLASVVVCTHNRSRLLAEACRSVLAVDFPSDAWELVIIDNRSTDDTLEVAHGIADEHPGRVRVIEEPAIGLSTARNRGIREARGEIVAFLDDDAFPDATWLKALVDALEQDSALAAGGPVEPLFEGDLPDWFAERYLPYLTVWDRGDQLHALAYNEYPRGANIAFRKEAFERFGGFSPELGRKGKSLRSCEEIEICLRIERGGGKILYVPGAGVRHRVSTERITPRWLVARFGAQGRSEAIIDWQHGGMRGLRKGLDQALRNAVGGFRHRHRDGKLLAHCHRGALWGYIDGMVRSVFTVRRYRPLEPATDWPTT
ncbi:MAG: glycosyltransferase [Acidobacteriota bacterium]